MKKSHLFICIAMLTPAILCAQRGDPKMTEVWKPVPPIVSPGSTAAEPPSDALVLFNGKNLDAWESERGGLAGWTVSDGFMTVKPGSGGIRTKEGFGSCQLHIEWKSPAIVKGEGQGRGNSGVFLMGNYEVQILDSYENSTYINGQAASLYKQYAPLVNASRKPGEWQSYDIIFSAPEFYDDGRVRRPAKVTVLHNGVLVQHEAELLGKTQYIGIASYDKHDAALPILLQDHGDLVSFRNIWIRKL